MRHSTNSTRKGKYVKKHRLGDRSPFQTGVNFGINCYKPIEDHIVAFAATAGDQSSFADIAAEVSRLLEAASVRERNRNPQLVPEVREILPANSTGRWPEPGFTDLAAAEDVYVRSRNSGPLKRRRLSKKARQRIGQAQSLRWAEFHRKKEAKQERDREAWLRRKQRLGKVDRKSKIENYSTAARGYWAKMTPAQRSAEMTRRKEVAAEKKKD